MKLLKRNYHLIPSILTNDQNFPSWTSSTILSGAIGSTTTIDYFSKGSSLVYALPERLMKSLLEETPTLTAKYMDAVGPYQHLSPKFFGGAIHRVGHGHHWLSDGLNVLNHDLLKLSDFLSHLGTDIVTKKGIPLFLDGNGIRSLHSGLEELGLNISKTTLANWNSLNAFDLLGSTFAIYDSSNNVIAFISGEARYSTEYAIKLSLTGTVKVAGGVISENPILVFSGLSDWGTLAYSYWEHSNSHLSQSIGIALESSLSAGLFGSAITTSIELIKTKGKLGNENLIEIAKRTAETASLAAIRSLSLPLAAGYTISKVGYSAAEKMVEEERLLVKKRRFSLKKDKSMKKQKSLFDHQMLKTRFFELYNDATLEEDHITYMELYVIKETLNREAQFLIKQENLPEELNKAFDFCLDLLNPEEVKFKTFKKNFLSLLGMAGGGTALIIALQSIVAPGLLASLSALIFGPSIFGPIGVAVGTIAIIGSLYSFMKDMDPKDLKVFCFELITKTFDEYYNSNEKAYGIKKHA